MLALRAVALPPPQAKHPAISFSSPKAGRVPYRSAYVDSMVRGSLDHSVGHDSCRPMPDFSPTQDTVEVEHPWSRIRASP
jgi:hypothetical protein